MLDATALVKLMAEPDRRRIVAALILASGDLESIIERTDLSRREVVTGLDRLRAAGLIEQGRDGTYVLLEETFKAAARSGADRPSTAPEADGPERSFVDGKLVHLPRKRSKRLLVLDRLAQEFEPGQHYPEREVNKILRAFDDDVAALRRYLVDERFLDRADGVYWRSGGSVDLSD
ncbi:MAG: DUF2087 domain-containing protein [Acidimicrobiales bacterium]